MSNVETMQAKSKEDILIEDGTDTIYLVRDIGLDGGFGIGIQNDGGFTCCLTTPKQWEEMKQKVDAFVKSRYGATNVDAQINPEQ